MTHLGQGAHVRAAYDEVVKILEDEVKDERPPDGDVVEDGPVGRV